jgi:hypothetical protein
MQPITMVPGLSEEPISSTRDFVTRGHVSKNPELLQYLSSNYICLRRYRNYEQISNRLIALRPDKPFLMVQKAYILCAETADVEGFRAVLAELPSSMKDDMIIVSVRFRFAVLARDWTDANEILTKSQNANLSFSYAQVNVPRECLKNRPRSSDSPVFLISL